MGRVEPGIGGSVGRSGKMDGKGRTDDADGTDSDAVPTGMGTDPERLSIAAVEGDDECGTDTGDPGEEREPSKMGYGRLTDGRDITWAGNGGGNGCTAPVSGWA